VTKAPRDGHNGKNGNAKAAVPSHFASKLISSVPHSRKGKHNLIVSMILDDLGKLERSGRFWFLLRTWAARRWKMFVPLSTGLPGREKWLWPRRPTKNIFMYGAQKQR
jgi:hypothetical protein